MDDIPVNHNVLELSIQEFMEEHEIEEYTMVVANNGIEAIKQAKEYRPDIIFMDIMMPLMDGYEATRCIKSLDSLQDIKVVMITALHDQEAKANAKKSGANGFIAKPFHQHAIDAILSKYIDFSQYKLVVEEEEDDEFIDFGEEDLFEELGESKIDSYLLEMENFNESHKKVSANDFLKNFADYELEIFYDEIDDMKDMIKEHIDILYEGNVERESEYILKTLEKLSSFLNHFGDFYELSTTIGLLHLQLKRLEYEDISEKSKEYISEFIKAILGDANNWFDFVFITQEAVDVYYINASMLNSCVQLQAIIDKK